MVWFQFYRYIFIGTHTPRLGRKSSRKRNQTQKNSENREKQAREGTGCFLLALGLPDPHHLQGRTTWEQSPDSQAARPRGKPRGLGGGDSQVLGPPSPPASILPQTPSPDPATYFWSTPAGRAPAGRAGRRPRPGAWWQRPLARSAFTSTRPCQPPGQAAARLEPTARPAPPSPAPSHQPRRSALSSAGLRRGVEEGTRPPGWGREGPSGRSPEDPWEPGRLRCWGAAEGGCEPAEGQGSRWARPGEGRRLGLLGVKLDPSLPWGPFPLSRTVLDVLGDTQRLLIQHRASEAATRGGRL